MQFTYQHTALRDSNGSPIRHNRMRLHSPFSLLSPLHSPASTLDRHKCMRLHSLLSTRLQSHFSLFSALPSHTCLLTRLPSLSIRPPLSSPLSTLSSPENHLIRHVLVQPLSIPFACTSHASESTQQSPPTGSWLGQG